MDLRLNNSVKAKTSPSGFGSIMTTACFAVSACSKPTQALGSTELSVRQIHVSIVFLLLLFWY